MSLQRTISINCPFCGHKQSAEIWDSINITDDPKLKNDVIGEKVNHTICLHCQREIEIANDLLYHDMKSKYMIWLKYFDNKNKPPLFNNEIHLLSPILSEYKLRLVTSWNQLIEKIQIFDSKLDDKSIEITKITMLNEWDDKDFPPEDRIFFQKLHKKLIGVSELLFWIYDPSFNEVKEVFVKNSFYNAIDDKLKSKISIKPDLKPNWLQINRDYAAKLMSQILSSKSVLTENFTIASKPDGTVMWKDDSGQTHERLFDPNEIKEFLRKSKARQVYRILIKDPISTRILEDYWQLTPDQIKNFVDEDSTAYCIVTYTENKERKQFLIIKDEWLKIPGYSH